MQYAVASITGHIKTLNNALQQTEIKQLVLITVYTIILQYQVVEGMALRDLNLQKGLHNFY